MLTAGARLSEDPWFTLASMDLSIPTVIPGEPMRVSASTYVAWKKCPDQANARFQGIYGPDTRPAFVGSLAHRIFSRHLLGGPIPHDDFAQACREEIGGSNLNQKMVSLGLKPSVLDDVIEEARSLYERFTRLPGEGFEGSEVELDFESDHDVELVGKIDAVFREDLGGHRLVDWKTGDLGDPADQLLFYSLLWGLAREELPAYVEAVSVRTGERFNTVPTSSDVASVARSVADLVNEMRKAWADGTNLEKRGGPWCRYCPILDDCPEGQAVEALLA